MRAQGLGFSHQHCIKLAMELPVIPYLGSRHWRIRSSKSSSSSENCSQPGLMILSQKTSHFLEIIKINPMAKLGIVILPWSLTACKAEA